MKFRHIADLAVVLISASNSAIAAPDEQAASAEQTDMLEMQIRKLNEDFFRSLRIRDLTLFNRVVDNNALFTRNHAMLFSRNQVIASFSTKHKYTGDLKNVRILGAKRSGHLAVVVGRLWIRDFAKKNLYVSFTNTFAQTSDEEWKLITSSLQEPAVQP